jgi:hypothetical protein
MTIKKNNKTTTIRKNTRLWQLGGTKKHNNQKLKKAMGSKKNTKPQ